MRKLLIPKTNFRKLQSIYKKKSDKYGQGGLIAVILASVIGTIIIGSTTQWFLSMNKTMGKTNDQLEAMTIAMSEWQRLEHMSLDELEANRENYKTPYKVGDNFTVGVNLGKQGFFDNGTCNALTGDYASESPNCFKDTTMTVYDKDGKAIYTTRSLPLSSQNANTGKGAQLYWIDSISQDKIFTTHTLQLATKYKEKEYILHDYSTQVQNPDAIVVNFQVSRPGHLVGTDTARWSITFPNGETKVRCSYFDDATSEDKVISRVKGFMSEYNMRFAEYSGAILADGDVYLGIKGIIEQ